MKQTHITRLSNPFALDIPEVRALFEKAFKNDIPAPVDDVLGELHRFVHHPDMLCLVGWEDMKAVGLMITRLPGTKLSSIPQVYHLFNSGLVGVRNGLIDATMDWARSKGYNTLLVANWTGADDKTFERAVSRGSKMLRIGSIYAMEFDDE